MSLYIIKQIDKVIDMPFRYRGIDPKRIKEYGQLEYDIKRVIPFDDKNYYSIITLTNKMYYNGINGKHPENLNKEIWILTVDKDYNVLKDEIYDDWYKTHRR